MLNERASSSAVQNLCQARFEAGAFSGGENDDSKIVV